MEEADGQIRRCRHGAPRIAACREDAGERPEETWGRWEARGGEGLGGERVSPVSSLGREGVSSAGWIGRRRNADGFGGEDDKARRENKNLWRIREDSRERVKKRWGEADSGSTWCLGVHIYFF